MLNAKELWDLIKDKDINVFAITSKVHEYCEPIDIDPIKCYLICKATAVLPALESALGLDYTCTLVDKYVLVEKKNAVR